MAKFRINQTTISLKLHIEEAAALHALLASIDAKTAGQWLEDMTLDTFAALDVARDILEAEGLWCDDFKDVIQERGGRNPLR